MTHEQVREFLDAYIDKELDLATTVEFDRHLKECADCRAICERYQEMHDSVRKQLTYYEAPEALQSRIRATLPAQEHDRGSSARALPMRWRTWAVAGVAAALILIGFGLFQGLRRSRQTEVLSSEVVASHIRSLMANHLDDVASSDQHTVKPWFSGKIDFAPTVKDLAPQGFSLVGGRLDYLSDRPVAALVYKRRQHTINLFLWPSPDSDSKPRAEAMRGYNIVHWTQSHMSYWAVSDLNAAELGEFADDLRK